jgi:hypothetical protein
MSSNSSKEEQVPRPRSSSTNEVSKPIAMLQRRQTHVGNSSIKGSLFYCRNICLYVHCVTLLRWFADYIYPLFSAIWLMM